MKTIEFVLFDGALGLDITGPLEIFNTATDHFAAQDNPRAGYGFRFAAREKDPVRLSSGLCLMPDAGFDTEAPIHALLVPGGSNLQPLMKDPLFMGYIKRRCAHASRIVSVCKGAFILAEAGVLNGREATTHWMATEELKDQYPDVSVRSDAIFVQDDNIYTSAGVTSGIDLALAMVEEDFGESVAMEVARRMVIYFRRPGFQSQFSAPLKARKEAGEKFARLHDWLLAHAGEPITVDEMAARAAMSPRHFARTFKTSTGMTPSKYLETLRLDRARELMISGGGTLEQIAEACGFLREERLRRAFLRRYGLTPSQYRIHVRKNGETS